MEDREHPTRPSAWIGMLIGAMAWVVTVAPLGLTLAAQRSQSTMRTTLIVGAAASWILVVLAYRGILAARQRQRRKELLREVAEVRQARRDAADVFQDKLQTQRAILDRISEISGHVLEEGIIDPHLSLKDVRLIRAHATTAIAHVDDAILEARVGTGSREVASETLNLRDEIEEIVTTFGHSEAGMATGGPVVFGETDPAMFRLIVRSLIAGAAERNPGHIDITVARNGDKAVCTITDDGPDCSSTGLDNVPALAHSLAAAVNGSLVFNRVLGRNQFSIEVACAEPAAAEDAAPMDVFRDTEMRYLRPDDADCAPRTLSPEGLLSFPQPGQRDRNESVAGRRERQLTAR
jgi:hypothetical protein